MADAVAGKWPECLAERIEGARPDIAVHDPDRTEEEGKESLRLEGIMRRAVM
ncbi:hypothetical protein D3C71_2118970 [compost metagenome]